jgi:Ca2+-transporting ATPase
MDWHELSLKDTISKLKSSRGGLSAKEAAKRLAEDGLNSIEIKKPVSPLHILINQFKNLLVILLLLAAFISLGVSLLNPEEADFIDAFLIFAIVIANALFGFFQEFKAEKSIEALAKMAAPRATVLRDDEEIEIDSTEVVIGDVLVLGEGDQVAADARIIECFSMFADESSLTGESMPSLKKPDTM